MTKGEAKGLETEVVIFPLDNNQNDEKVATAKEAAEDVLVEEKSIKSDLENRFVRLKKSLRKRSASIL